MKNLCCKINFILILLTVCNYGIAQSGSVSEKNNTKQIEDLFQKLKNSPSSVLKRNKIISNKSTVYEAFDQIIWGDLNGDNMVDALLPFWVSERDGGDLSEAYYAVFITKNGKLEYDFSYSTGIAGTYLDWPLIQFEKIKDGKIYGRETNKNDVYSDFPYWVYQYAKGNIETLYEPLHPTLGGDYELKPLEYLKPFFVKMPDGKELDIEPSVKALKAYFGNDFKIKPYTTEVCDGPFRLPYSEDYKEPTYYGELPFAHFEINNKNKAAWDFIDFTKTDAILITEQGYINKRLTLKDLKKAFPKTCKEFFDDENGMTIISVSTTKDEELLNGIMESAWQVAFNKKGQIQWIKYWGAC